MKDIIDWDLYLNLQEDPNRYDMRIVYYDYDIPVIQSQIYEIGEWVSFADYKALKDAYDKLVFKVLEQKE